MKRILHVVGTMDRAGAETMVMNLYRAINKEKYQFDFVYFTKKKCAYDDEILSLGGTIYRIPEHKAKSPINRTLQLYRIIKGNKPFYAVHCHQLFSNAFHLTAAYFCGITMRIAHSHNTSDANSKSYLGKAYQKFSKLLINTFATNFIACGQKAGEFLFSDKKEVIFIPNAIDVPKFLEAENNKISSFFREIPSIEKTLVITQIGRFMPVKNHEFTINLAKYLKTTSVDFHFFFAGSGELENKLKQSVAENGLSDNITFLGVRSDVEKVLAHSDIMLMPSFHEGFPVILVESQTAGVPALVSDSISNEVDLGLGLVKFCSLDDPFEIWKEKIKQLNVQEKVNKQKRLETIQKKGFDITISVKLLEKIYDTSI